MAFNFYEGRNVILAFVSQNCHIESSGWKGPGVLCHYLIPGPTISAGIATGYEPDSRGWILSNVQACSEAHQWVSVGG
jgi:hypothetical protein